MHTVYKSTINLLFILLITAFSNISEAATVLEKASFTSTLNEELSVSSMEEMLGRKTTLKERIGLRILRRQITKHVSKASLQSDCEKIILKNGELLEVNIVEITETNVRYKPCGKPDHPDFSMALESVLSIIGRDGSIVYRSTTSEMPLNDYADTREEPRGLMSMILGLVGMIMMFLIPIVGYLFLVTAMALGILSIREVKRNPAKYRGNLFAWIGIGMVILTFLVLLISLVSYGVLYAIWS